MHRRCLSLAALVALALPVRAADKDEAPSLVIRARSIDGLLEDARYLVTLLGKGEEAKQFDGFVKSMIGPKGLEGIDTKKPFGFYGTVGPNAIDSTGVLLLPIADEKAFLGFLERFDLKIEKQAGGLYSFTPARSPVTAFFRFANGYVYATVETKAAVAKDKLLAPADVLPSNLTSALSMTIRFDQIPNEIKQLVLQQMALKVADAQRQKLPNETDPQQEFRGAILKDFERYTQLLKEGRGLSMRFNLDRKEGKISVDASLTGKPDSKLASEIADLGKSTSLFAGAIGSDSAVNLMLHATLPPEVRKAMAPVIDEGMKIALEKEKDEKRRALADKFLTAIGPTLKSGDFDGAVTVRGPNSDGKYAVLLGVKLTDGDMVEKGFRNLVKDLREEEQAKIKFDVDKAGPYKIHMLDVKKELDAKSQHLFGNDSQVYMAFRNDAWLLAGGAGGLQVLKEALTAKPKEGPQFQFEMAVKRVAPAMEQDNPNLAKILEAAFAKESPDSDKVRFAVEGGKALRTHFTISTAVVKFFAELGRSKKAKVVEKE